MIKREYLNVPNTLSVSRVLFLPLLYIFMLLDWMVAFVVAYIIIGSTDFFDGICARLLNQKSELGKTLDSLADIFFYFSSAYFLWVLFRPVIEANLVILNLLFGIIGLSFVISWVKLRKPVMMHTRIMRLGGVLVYLLVVLSFVMDTTYFATGIILLYTIGFVEEILIFLIYGYVDRDTQSIWHARKANRGGI